MSVSALDVFGIVVAIGLAACITISLLIRLIEIIIERIKERINRSRTNHYRQQGYYAATKSRNYEEYKIRNDHKKQNT